MFDLDAVSRESDGIPFEFTFGGEKFTLPATVDLLAAAALEGGKLYDGLKRLLGDEQWERLLEVQKVLDTEHLKALMEAYAKHVGLSLGESGASTGSSSSTGGLSKPTSSGTTTLR
jgi:hypothetical protein